MKNLFKFLPVALVSLFVLGACAQPVDQTGEGVTPDQQTQTQEQEQEQEQEQAVDPMASRYGANLNCDMMKDANNKQDCERQLNEVIGSMLESEIYSTFDASRCDELGGQMAEICKTRLAETGVKGPVSADELALFNEIMRGTPSDDPAASPVESVSFDEKKCEELKTEGLSAFCVQMIEQRRDQIKFEDIVNSGDVERCDEFTDVNRQNECKMFFGVEVTPVEEPVAEPVVEEAEVEEEVAADSAAEQEAALEITEAEEVEVEVQ